jgi:HK97 family phage prohead protease
MIERRSCLELRAVGRRLEGVAAPYGVTAHVAGFDERVLAGAFTKTLADGHDILALVDHDQGKLLGRTRNGSLRLQERAQGLLFELDVPETTLGRDVLTLAQRGDLGGMSFAFRVKPAGERWIKNTRELRQVDLVEISAIHAWPVYDGTSVAARSRRPRLNLAERYLETV